MKNNTLGIFKHSDITPSPGSSFSRKQLKANLSCLILPQASS